MTIRPLTKNINVARATEMKKLHIVIVLSWGLLPKGSKPPASVRDL